MSILLIHNGIFIFHSDTYLYHDLTAKEVDNSPKVIQTAFNIPFSTIDAALRWDDETVFFFNGMDCLKYNLMTKSVVSGYPKKILFEWRGIWPSDLSEAIRMDSKVFFFRKTQCISYDVQLGKADTGYPKPIADEWRGVSDSVDGAEYLGQDKILFLRGDQVIRYDVQHRHADAGYPIDVQAYVQGYSSTNTATDFNTDMRIIHDYVSAAIGASNKIASSYLSAIHNLQATIQAASPSETRPEVLASILKVGLITAEKLMIPDIKEASGTELRPIVDLVRRISDEIDKAADQASLGGDWVNEFWLSVTNTSMPDQSGENLQAQMEDEYNQNDGTGRRRYMTDIENELTAVQTLESPSVQKLELAMYTEWINQNFNDDCIDGTGYLYIQFADDGTLSSATVRSPLGDKIAVALNEVMTKAGVSHLRELDVVKKVCAGDITVCLERNNLVRKTPMNNETLIAFALDDALQHVTQFTT